MFYFVFFCFFVTESFDKFPDSLFGQCLLSLPWTDFYDIAVEQLKDSIDLAAPL